MHSRRRSRIVIPPSAFTTPIVSSTADSSPPVNVGSSPVLMSSGISEERLQKALEDFRTQREAEVEEVVVGHLSDLTPVIAAVMDTLPHPQGPFLEDLHKRLQLLESSQQPLSVTPQAPSDSENTHSADIQEVGKRLQVLEDSQPSEMMTDIVKRLSQLELAAPQETTPVMKVKRGKTRTSAVTLES